MSPHNIATRLAAAHAGLTSDPILRANQVREQCDRCVRLETATVIKLSSGSVYQFQDASCIVITAGEAACILSLPCAPTCMY